MWKVEHGVHKDNIKVSSCGAGMNLVKKSLPYSTCADRLMTLVRHQLITHCGTVLSLGNHSVMVVRAHRRPDFTLVKYIMIMRPALLLLFVRQSFGANWLEDEKRRTDAAFTKNGEFCVLSRQWERLLVCFCSFKFHI